MRARDVLERFEEEQGWDHTTMISILVAFVDKEELAEELEEHLEEVVAAQEEEEV